MTAVYELENPPREIEEVSIGRLRESMVDTLAPLYISTRDITVDLTEERTITLPTRNGDFEFEATGAAQIALATWLGIPTTFFERLDPEMRQDLMRYMILRDGGDGQAYYNTLDNSLTEFRKPEALYVPGWQIVEVAAHTLGTEGRVVDVIDTPNDFMLDVIVHEESSFGIGGDRRVGDLTHGGLRFGHDRKRNLAPWVQPYFFRLVCTNGMEVIDKSLKIDARKAETVEEVMEELEVAARRAMGRMDHTIEKFYDLRNQSVGQDVAGAILRVSREENVPDSTRLRLATNAPAFVGDVTMFDIVNVITNAANVPGVKIGERRRLEQAGGAIVTKHVMRCSHCHGALHTDH